jgi:ureidoglycolate dehydrogenase (NAD+)
MRILEEHLTCFAAKVLAKAGLPSEDAQTVADVLVWANSRGVDSHGISRLAAYVEETKTGAFNVTGRAQIHQLLPATFKMDCNKTAGPACMIKAAGKCIELARVNGVGVGLLSDPTHLGAVGYYADWIAKRGFAAVVMVAGRPFMAYHGAKAATVGTSPIAIGIPSGDFEEGPLLLDMASSVIAAGRIRQAVEQDKSLPEGSAIDGDGKVTTDPRNARTVLSLGGPKGSGLSLMFECLAGVLAGTPIVAAAARGISNVPLQNSILIVLNIENFRGMPEYVSDIIELKAAVRSFPRRSGFDELLLPGERGRREARRRQRDGIPIAANTWQELKQLATALHIELPVRVA